MDKEKGKFESVTIFVLATNETELLKETMDRLASICSVEDIEKVIIVLKNEHCLSCNTAREIVATCKAPKTEIYFQKSKDIEGCVTELPWLVQSSHFIIMAADMEMDPKSVKDLILISKKYPQKIICASKWHKKSIIKGYGKLHEFASRTMNKFVSILFNVRAADSFSIFQIYPLEIYKKMKFQNSLRPAYEYTLKPLRCGVEYEEIPTVYNKRSEKKSNFNFFHLLLIASTFCITAIRLRFTSKNKLLQ